MTDRFTLQITTPERLFYKNEVESLVLTSTEGEIGILGGHMSMVIALVPAPVRIKAAGKDAWIIAALSGGFARIEGDRVTVLVDTAEWPEEIETNRALEAKRRAEERIRARTSEIEYIRSRAALERALIRLAVKNGNRGGG